MGLEKIPEECFRYIFEFLDIFDIVDMCFAYPICFEYARIYLNKAIHIRIEFNNYSTQRVTRCFQILGPRLLSVMFVLHLEMAESEICNMFRLMMINCQNITHLTLTDYRPRRTTLQILDRIAPNLIFLKMSSCDCHDDEIHDFLMRCTRLKKLNLQLNLNITGDCLNNLPITMQVLTVQLNKIFDRSILRPLLIRIPGIQILCYLRDLKAFYWERDMDLDYGGLY